LGVESSGKTAGDSGGLCTPLSSTKRGGTPFSTEEVKEDKHLYEVGGSMAGEEIIYSTEENRFATSKKGKKKCGPGEKGR